MSDEAAPQRVGRTKRLIKARGLLFDCDGVLVNSDASVISAWSRWASHYSLDPTEVVAVVHGRRSADTVSALIAPRYHDEALAMINAFEVEDASTVQAIAGARRLVASLPHGAWAIVTSGLLRLAEARIIAAGLPIPASLVTADRVSKGKPDPEGYLMAASLLGLPIKDCIVIEDAADGVRAARAAGAGAVVGVGPRLDHTSIDAHVDDLTTLTWGTDGLSVSVEPTTMTRATRAESGDIAKSD